MVPQWTERTAIDLFGRVLASLIEGDADDVLADRALLDTCIRFARLPSGDFDEVRLDVPGVGRRGSGGGLAGSSDF